MIYSDFQNIKLSSLGMGCMRFPLCGEADGDVDVNAAREIISYAMENGINYYDTAWGYHHGRSEIIMGEILKDYPRDSFYLASKFPGYDLANMDKVEEIFEKQLEKCQVDYFDFYLFHNVCEMNVNEYLDPKYGIFEYLLKQKEAGRIRHLGFSAHGNPDTMKKFLDAYKEHMEFCQLQINWLDWEFQGAKEKVELVSSYNIPVWVMEPVRGGSLANLKPQHEARLREFRPEISNAEWAFRFIQSLPEVKVTLSGMSDMKQLKENIATYEKSVPLTTDEMNMLFGIGRAMTAKDAIPCTACRYCVSHCPKELNIPWLIELYNEHAFLEGGFIVPMAVSALSQEELPSACIGCGGCEAVCPQNIKVSDVMKNFAENI